MQERNGIILTTHIDKRIWLCSDGYGISKPSLIEEGADHLTVIIANGYKCTVKESFDEVLKAFGLVVAKPDTTGTNTAGGNDNG